MCVMQALVCVCMYVCVFMRVCVCVCVRASLGPPRQEHLSDVVFSFLHTPLQVRLFLLHTQTHTHTHTQLNTLFTQYRACGLTYGAV